MPFPQRIEAVLLDWDGTLLDSCEADTRAYQEMFQRMGIDWGIEEVNRHYSPDWYRVYRAAGLPRERWEEADRVWRRAYEKHRPKLVAGAPDVLRRLGARYRLGLVSSGSDERVGSQLRRFRLAAAFAVRVCHEDSRHCKPHPQPLRIALGRLAIPAALSVYVGDSPEDIQMARRAGVRAVGVLGSFPTERRLRASCPDALLDSLYQLPELLERWHER